MVTSTSEVAITDIICVEVQRRTLDVDVTIGCYQGDYNSWDNVEL